MTDPFDIFQLGGPPLRSTGAAAASSVERDVTPYTPTPLSPEDRAERARVRAAQIAAVRPHMPHRSEVPKHAVRQVWLPCRGAMKGGHRWRLTPWQLQGGAWHAWQRLFVRNDHVLSAARVYVNGFGTDHELRFQVFHRTSGHGPEDTATVHDVRTRPRFAGYVPTHGAANDFLWVPGLTFTTPPKHPPSERGLYEFRRQDVIDVMRWADGLLDAWYPAAPTRGLVARRRSV